VRSPTNDCWHQKTRVPGLSHGAVSVILRLAVLVQYGRVTDGRTDTRRQNICSASIASSWSSTQGRGGRSVRSPRGRSSAQLRASAADRPQSEQIWCSQAMGGRPHSLRQFGKGGTPSRTSHATRRTVLSGT